MKSPGFTLLEIIIVIALVGLISTIAIVSFSSVSGSIRIKELANEIVSDLQLAEQKAASERSDFELVFKENNYTFLGRTREYGSGIKLQNPITIKFASSGNPYPGHFGTISISNGKKTIKIVVSSIGRVRTE